MFQREKSESEIYCEIKEAFQLFDTDNDGIITKGEEETILRMFEINPNEKEDKNTKKDEKKAKEGEQNEDE
jgi:Ca2+-binding EF-hand superfamily protein